MSRENPGRPNGERRIVYSAYNAAPPGLTEDPDAEDSWYNALRADSRIGGLELPILGGRLHPHGVPRLAKLLDPEWSNTVSAMSETLVASISDSDYGLASVDMAGRRRALDHIATAREETLHLQGRLGPSSIRAFALQSAPRANRSNVEAFTDSLIEVAAWDWGNIELLVEHSDALTPGRTPQKGYLSLEDEMAAVRSVTESGTRQVRHLLNWGRSAIEGRSAGTPSEHVQALGEGLGAFAFSGAAPVATNRSAEWEDVHLGLADDEPASLLTAEAVRALIAQLPDGLSYLGIKAGAPAGSRGLERLRLGQSMLDVLT